MSYGQRPGSVWELWAGLRRILAAAGIPAPPRTSEMEWRAYQRFKTGLTFAEIARSMYSTSDDPKDWPRRTRGTILGSWWATKQRMWRELQRREDEATATDRGYPASWDDVGGGGQLGGGE